MRFFKIIHYNLSVTNSNPTCFFSARWLGDGSGTTFRREIPFMCLFWATAVNRIYRLLTNTLGGLSTLISPPERSFFSSVVVWSHRQTWEACWLLCEKMFLRVSSVMLVSVFCRCWLFSSRARCGDQIRRSMRWGVGAKLSISCDSRWSGGHFTSVTILSNSPIGSAWSFQDTRSRFLSLRCLPDWICNVLPIVSFSTPRH